MKSTNNSFVLSGLLFLTTLIALVYCFINYNHSLLIILCAGSFFILGSYFFLINVNNLIRSMQTSSQMQIRNGFNDVSNILETINSENTKLSKATYLYVKQASNKIDLINTNDKIYNDRLVSTIQNMSSAQAKATKVLIKYNDSNTNKLISSMNESKTSLSNVYLQGFDQLQSDNDSLVNIVSQLQNLVTNSSNTSTSTLALQLKDVTNELHKIADSINHINLVPATMTMPATQVSYVSQEVPTTAMPSYVQQETITTTSYTQQESPTLLDEFDLEGLFTGDSEISSETTLLDQDDILLEDNSNDSQSTEEPFEDPFEESFEEEFEEPVNSKVTNISDVIAEKAAPPEPAPLPMPDLSGDPNKQLTPEEIAALFSALG